MSFAEYVGVDPNIVIQINVFLVIALLISIALTGGYVRHINLRDKRKVLVNWSEAHELAKKYSLYGAARVVALTLLFANIAACASTFPLIGR